MTRKATFMKVVGSHETEIQNLNPPIIGLKREVQHSRNSLYLANLEFIVNKSEAGLKQIFA